MKANQIKKGDAFIVLEIGGTEPWPQIVHNAITNAQLCGKGYVRIECSEKKHPTVNVHGSQPVRLFRKDEQ